MALIGGVRNGISASAPAGRAAHHRVPMAFGMGVPEISEPSAVAPPAGLAGLDALLALQEAESGAVGERKARRHGQQMLAELGRLQIALLAPDGMSGADLGRLSGLCDALPYTADDGLRTLLQSIALRARIELMRRG